MAAPASTGTWTCPGCERRVPRREPRCHCGAARLELTADSVASGAAPASPALIAVVVLLVAGCVLLLVGRGGSPHARAGARPSAGTTGSTPRPGSAPGVFPPLPELPPEPE